MNPTQKLKLWSEFLGVIRNWMQVKGFYEVTTPSLVAAGAIEPYLDPLKVSFSTGEAELHTSPEFEMKWLFAQSKLPIYQICKVFRDDPQSSIHKREFSMLEFYRPEASIIQTADDLKSLIRTLTKTDLPFEELTVAEAIKKYAGVHLFAPLEVFRREVVEIAGVWLSPEDHWDDIYAKLMVEKVEPNIGQQTPTLLRDFPASLAALAQVTGNPPVAKRFEIYWKGMELCNGFDELTDLGELKTRIESASRLRLQINKQPHPFPTRLHAAMKMGLPRSSGVAVGLDRLFQCLHDDGFEDV